MNYTLGHQGGIFCRPLSQTVRKESLPLTLMRYNLLTFDPTGFVLWLPFFSALDTRCPGRFGSTPRESKSLDRDSIRSTSTKSSRFSFCLFFPWSDVSSVRVYVFVTFRRGLGSVIKYYSYPSSQTLPHLLLRLDYF